MSIMMGRNNIRLANTVIVQKNDDVAGCRCYA